MPPSESARPAHAAEPSPKIATMQISAIKNRLWFIISSTCDRIRSHRSESSRCRLDPTPESWLPFRFAARRRFWDRSSGQVGSPDIPDAELVHRRLRRPEFIEADDPPVAVRLGRVPPTENHSRLVGVLAPLNLRAREARAVGARRKLMWGNSLIGCIASVPQEGQHSS